MSNQRLLAEQHAESFSILRDLGINFEGYVYFSKDLQKVTDIFYQLGFTYYTEGNYSEGIFIKTTGVVKDVL